MKKIKNIILHSSLDNLSLVENYIEDLKISKSIKDAVFGKISVAVTEAITNAIAHGNRCDISKRVTFETFEQRNSLIFRVIDEGSGFDPNMVPDPTLPDNLDRENGRGVFLMRHLSDKITFCGGEYEGTIVEMDFIIKK